MAYAKFDDQFGLHPKVRQLTPPAFQLHVCGILHSARLLTDGKVTADALPDLMRKYRPAYLTELLTAGLWRELAPDALYEIHDYLEWNDSRAKVEARRQRNADRIAKWRREHGKDDPS
jgi:hypothetical protein